MLPPSDRSVLLGPLKEARGQPEPTPAVAIDTTEPKLGTSAAPETQSSLQMVNGKITKTAASSCTPWTVPGTAIHLSIHPFHCVFLHLLICQTHQCFKTKSRGHDSCLECFQSWRKQKRKIRRAEGKQCWPLGGRGSQVQGSQHKPQLCALPSM